MSFADYFGIVSAIAWWVYFYLYILKSDCAKMRGVFPSPAMVEYALPDKNNRMKIKWLNSAACLLMKQKREKIIGHNADEFVTYATTNDFRELTKKVLDELDTYGTATFKYHYIRGDGEVITLRSELYNRYNNFLNSFFKIKKRISIIGYTIRIF